MKIAVLLLAATTCLGQQLPDNPKPQPQPITKYDWNLLDRDVLFHGIDVVSTNYMLHHGGHELFLPDFISHHPVTMTVFSGAVVAVDFYGHRKLERKHRKLANILQEAEIASTGFWSLDNFTINGVNSGHQNNQVIRKSRN